MVSKQQYVFIFILFLTPITHASSTIEQSTPSTLKTIQENWKTYATITGCIAISGLLYYLNRESNDDKIQRAEDLLTKTQDTIDQLFGSIALKKSITPIFKESESCKASLVTNYYKARTSAQEIAARNSWLKPWNWSEKLDKTDKKIKALVVRLSPIHEVIKHEPCLANSDMHQKLQHARRQASETSLYPITDFIEELKRLRSNYQKQSQTDQTFSHFANAFDAELSAFKGYADYYQEQRDQDLRKQLRRIELQHMIPHKPSISITTTGDHSPVTVN